MRNIHSILGRYLQNLIGTNAKEKTDFITDL